jgi:hypothetical protein
MNAAKAKRTIEAVLVHVVAQDFDALLGLAPRSRLTATDLRAALLEYGRVPIMPPALTDLRVDVAAVRNSRPPSWSVYLPLWTKEEGMSDLTLEMHFTESDAEIYAVEIDDLHVL